MKRFKGMVFGLIIGIPLGLWFGFNLGKDRPVFSNPFNEGSFQDTIRQTGENLIEKSGEVLEKSGQALQKRSQDEEPLPLPPEETFPPR